MKLQKGFAKTQSKLMVDDTHMTKKTLVIDIYNTLVTQIDIKNAQELNEIKNLPNFSSDYVLVNMKEYQR